MTDGKKHFWETPYIDWISEIPENWIALVLYIRPARVKAKVAAVVESLCLLEEWNTKALIGGPFSEQAGVFWLALPKRFMNLALARIPRLGYVQAADLLIPIESKKQIDYERKVRWRKVDYGLVRIYEEDSQTLRENAPDRRIFLLRSNDGEVRPVRGYRGSGAPLERRGLPVYDARMLVNLVTRKTSRLLLDPFAGIGGIILEAEANGNIPVSVDNDPALRYGLAQLSAFHCVADARSLPFSSGIFDAIATEPPYHENAAMVVVQALQEMNRVLLVGGRLAILCTSMQADALLLEAKLLGLVLYLNSPINRKGLDLYALAWQK